MTDDDTFILFGAVYDSQEAAEMDYDAVKSLHVSVGATRPVVIDEVSCP